MGCESSSSVKVEDNYSSTSTAKAKTNTNTVTSIANNNNSSIVRSENNRDNQNISNQTEPTTLAPKPLLDQTRMSSSRVSSAASNKSANEKKMKLVYFDFTGRAEIARVLFNIGGMQFTDERFSFEDWPKIKPTTPLGTVPLLHIGSNPPLVQSVAIARYIAKETGLAGRTNLEMAQADAVVDTAVALFDKFAGEVFPELKGNTEKAPQVLEKFLKETAPPALANLEKLIQLYGKNGFFVGDQLTWADVYVHLLIKTIAQFNPNVIESFEGLKLNQLKVSENPKIAEYFKTH